MSKYTVKAEDDFLMPWTVLTPEGEAIAKTWNEDDATQIADALNDVDSFRLKALVVDELLKGHSFDEPLRGIEKVEGSNPVAEREKAKPFQRQSSMYGMDFSILRRDMKLSDVAAEVKEQNVHWGSFEEILKTTDPELTVEQFGRRFMTERILVAGGTPKQIVDKLEAWHFETGANGGFMLARGFSAPGNLQEFVDHVVPELQRRGLSKKKYAGRTLRENLLN